MRSDARTDRAMRGLVVLYTVTALLGAVLVFSVQPMIAKRLLPVFGGSASVWNVCVVFFQTSLLLGYIYAHQTWMTFKHRQPWLHLMLLLLPLPFLPFALPEWAAPPENVSTALWLLLVLTVSFGLPFLMVSTTSPLLQAWFATTKHTRARDPYFLYAAGNAGSLLALAAYPFLIEPNLSNEKQATIWATGYGILVLLLAICAISKRHFGVEQPQPESPNVGPQVRISARTRTTWLLLAALPTSLLIAVTTFITTDVAAVPLLWVLPLGLYLATFILAFGTSSPNVARSATLLAVSAVAMSFVNQLASETAFAVTIVLQLTAFSALSLVLHCRLASSRPPAAQLTKFYVYVSLGGMLGGAVTTLIAPLIFDRSWEHNVAFVFSLVTVAYIAHSATRENSSTAPRYGVLLAALPVIAVVPLALEVEAFRDVLPLVTIAIAAFGLTVLKPQYLALGLAAVFLVSTLQKDSALLTERSFFGIYRVAQQGDFHDLFHGSTLHGTQNTSETKRREPLSYYSKDGPLGDIFAIQQQRGQATATGVIGLGTGSIAAYGRQDDAFTFYEIDPLMVKIASNRRYFTFLSDSPATLDFVVGDGRLKVAEAPPNSFDILVLDAFSSDSIPVHLLTVEAFHIYRSKLKPGGVLAVNISNRYLNLEPVVVGVSRSANLSALIRKDDPAQLPPGKSASVWVAVAPEVQTLQPLSAISGWTVPREAPGSGWTDNNSNIIQTLR